MPAEAADSRGQCGFKNFVTVAGGGPQFVVAGDEKLWPCELKSFKAALQAVAVRDGGVAGSEQRSRVRLGNRLRRAVEQLRACATAATTASTASGVER